MKKPKNSILKLLPMIAFIIFQSCSSTNQIVDKKPILVQSLIIPSDSLITIKPIRPMNKYERDVAELLKKCGMTEYDFPLKEKTSRKKPFIQ